MGSSLQACQTSAWLTPSSIGKLRVTLITLIRELVTLVIGCCLSLNACRTSTHRFHSGFFHCVTWLCIREADSATCAIAALVDLSAAEVEDLLNPSSPTCQQSLQQSKVSINANLGKLDKQIYHELSRTVSSLLFPTDCLSQADCFEARRGDADTVGVLSQSIVCTLKTEIRRIQETVS